MTEENYEQNRENYSKEVTRDNLREKMIEVLKTFTPEEQKIAGLSYESGREYTLQELGRIFKVIRERIRKLEEKAIRKL